MDVADYVTKMVVWLEDWPFAELISAFIGAIVGGILTMRATIKAHTLESARLQKEQQKILVNTLCLIKEELTAAIDIYREEYASELLALADTEPYLCLFPIGNNPFPIYDSAPTCLADAPPEISKTIIRLYMRTKGLISMIELNNSDYEAACIQGRKAIERLHETFHQQRIPYDQNTQLLIEDTYNRTTTAHANFLGMGENTRTMKLLTLETYDLFDSVASEIDKFIANSADQKSKKLA